LLLIGVGAAGDQYPHTREGSGKLFHRCLDLHPPLVRFGHFVQPIEQEQSPGALQVIPQWVSNSRNVSGNR
jgi:hypothetical protein